MEKFKFSKETPIEIPRHVLFEVVGAGEIQLSLNPSVLCGTAAGFSFGVSWTKNHFTGGVIGITEAKRLAMHILEACEKVEQSEDALRDRLWKEYEQ